MGGGKLDKNGNPPKYDKGGASLPDWPPTPDQSPTKIDTGYKGGPFGCTHDAECFGLKCCPTPWGVKLCAESCTW